jgi:DNA mismatch repair protein MutS
MTELPLFSAMAPPPVMQKSAVESALALLHPDSLSPKDALEKLYELQALLKMSQK